MNQTPTSQQSPRKKRWPIRVTLYQMFVMFSIAAAVLLLRRIESQQVELRTKRATLFPLDHDLYIDEPNRLAGVQRPLKSVNELSWSIYVPRGTSGKLIIEGQTIGELTSGIHQIHAKLWRSPFDAPPSIIAIKKLLIDDQANEVDIQIEEIDDDPNITAPTTVALGEKLPLLFKSGPEREIQMWVEAN